MEHKKYQEVIKIELIFFLFYFFHRFYPTKCNNPVTEPIRNEYTCYNGI